MLKGINISVLTCLLNSKLIHTKFNDFHIWWEKAAILNLEINRLHLKQLLPLLRQIFVDFKNTNCTMNMQLVKKCS